MKPQSEKMTTTNNSAAHKLTDGDLLKLIRPNILALEPYSTARDEFDGQHSISAWLDANESPYDNGLNRYPDPHQRELKKLIAENFGGRPEMVFIGGAGSDEAIDLCYRIFCRPGIDNAIAISPTYGVYSVAAQINDVEYRQVALNPDYTLSVEALLEAADENSRLMWICSPNNPTANSFSLATIAELAEGFRGMVVVDEAYFDFSGQPSAIELIEEHRNIIVLRTFSKARGLASLRVGMAFATPLVARYFAMVKYPYNVNGPTQQEIARRITDDVATQIAEILSERKKLVAALNQLPLVKEVFPSDANFILARFDDPDGVYDYLSAGGVLVRNRNRVAGCKGCLRITVGTPAENTLLLKLLTEWK